MAAVAGRANQGVSNRTLLLSEHVHVPHIHAPRLEDHCVLHESSLLPRLLDLLRDRGEIRGSRMKGEMEHFTPPPPLCHLISGRVSGRRLFLRCMMLSTVEREEISDVPVANVTVWGQKTPVTMFALSWMPLANCSASPVPGMKALCLSPPAAEEAKDWLIAVTTICYGSVEGP